MKRIIKFFIYLIILLIIVVVAIPFLFKGKIVEITKSEINKSLEAKVDFGDFDLTVFHSFPDLTFYIKDVSVVGVNRFAGDTLMYIGNLKLNLDLLSVFGDQIEVKAISVDNPKIKAKVLKDGTANWDIVPEDTTVVEVDTTEEESSFKLNLNSLVVNNATVIYDDAEMDVYQKLERLDLAVDGNFTESTSDINLKMNAKALDFNYEGVEYLKNAVVEFSAVIFSDLDKSIYKFKENELKINDLSLKFEGIIEMPKNDIIMDIKLLSKDNFKKLMSLVPSVFTEGYENVKITGNYDFKTFIKGIYNDSLMPSYDINLLVDGGSIKYPDLPEDVKNISLDLRIFNKDSMDLNKTVVDLKKLHLEIAGNPVDAKFVSYNILIDPFIDAYLKTHLDLASLEKAIPMDSVNLSGTIDADVTLKGKTSSLESEKYDEFEAKGGLKISDLVYKTESDPIPIEIKTMDFEFAPQYFYLKNFVLYAGQTDITANGKLLNFLQYYFKDSLLKGEFNIKSNVIDVNQWLTGEETTESATGEVSEDTVSLEIIEVPRNIDFTLKSYIKKVYYDKMTIKNINGTLRICGGAVEMDNLSLDMLGGKVIMSGEYNTKVLENPFVSYKLNIKNVDLNKVYKSFETIKKVAPILENSSGYVSGTLDISTNLLNDFSPKMETMNGYGNFQTRDLVLKESGVFKFMNSFFKTDKFKEIKANNVNLSIKIVNGKIELVPFEINPGNVKARIEGEQYIDGGLNYKIDWTMPREVLGNVGVNALNDLASQLNKSGIELGDTRILDFKTLITGTLSDPNYKITLGNESSNVVEDIKQQVEDKVKEEIDKKKQEAIKKAKEEAEKLLAEAKEKAKKIRDEAHKQAEKIRKEGRNTAKKIRDEAKKKGDDLIKKANNPVAKKAAKVTAEKLMQEADKKANRVENEANAKADKLEQEADKKAKKIVEEAKKKGDELIKKAENA